MLQEKITYLQIIKTSSQEERIYFLLRNKSFDFIDSMYDLAVILMYLNINHRIVFLRHIGEEFIESKLKISKDFTEFEMMILQQLPVDKRIYIIKSIDPKLINELTNIREIIWLLMQTHNVAEKFLLLQSLGIGEVAKKIHNVQDLCNLLLNFQNANKISLLKLLKIGHIKSIIKYVSEIYEILEAIPLEYRFKYFLKDLSLIFVMSKIKNILDIFYFLTILDMKDRVEFISYFKVSYLHQQMLNFINILVKKHHNNTFSPDNNLGYLDPATQGQIEDLMEYVYSLLPKEKHGIIKNVYNSIMQKCLHPNYANSINDNSI